MKYLVPVFNEQGQQVDTLTFEARNWEDLNYVVDGYYAKHPEVQGNNLVICPNDRSVTVIGEK